MRLKWSTLLLGVLVVVALVMYPQLPDVVVSHWGFDGPDGWAPKRVFVPVLVGAAVVIQLLVSGVFWLRTPERYTNIPNKGYWLAPERADATWQRTAVFADATMFLTHGLFLLVLHLSAQMSGAPVLFPIPLALANWMFVGTILLLCVALPVWFFLSFRLPAVERARIKREKRARRKPS